MVELTTLKNFFTSRFLGVFNLIAGYLLESVQAKLVVPFLDAGALYVQLGDAANRKY